MYPWHVLLFFSVAVKSVLLIAATAVVACALRNASAAIRCLVRQTAIAALLALPILSIALPVWRIPVLPGAGLSGVHGEGPADTGRRGHRAGWPGIVDEQGTDLRGSLPEAVPPSTVPLRRTTWKASAPPRTGAWTPWAVTAWVWGFWLAGFMAVVTPAVFSQRAARRLLRQARTVEAGELYLALRAVQGELGLSTPVRLLVGREAGLPAVPMTCGLSPATVLLPHAASTWAPDRLRSVLLHELAHVIRRDWLWRWLGVLACGLYWWNPGVWLVERRLREDTEAACDDRVLGAGVTPSTYAAHLLEIARGLGGSPAGRGVLTMTQGGNLSARLAAVLASGRSRATPDRAQQVLARASLAVVLVPLAVLFPGPRQGAAAPAGSRPPGRANDGAPGLGVSPGSLEAGGHARPERRLHRPLNASGSTPPKASTWVGATTGSAQPPTQGAPSPVTPAQPNAPQSIQPEVGLGPVAWGKGVGGVRTSLRVPKARWKAMEPIVLTLDVCNQGSQPYSQARVPLFAEVEVDGTWYQYDGSREASVPVWPLEPGKYVYNWVQLSPDASWVEKSPARNRDAPGPGRPRRLQLANGRHVLRVAFPFHRGAVGTGAAIRPVSYPVEIHVEGDPAANRPGGPP